MISYLEAIEKLAQEAKRKGCVNVASHEAMGRLCRESIDCPEDLPSFDNAAMDGFAVRSAEVRDTPIRLKVMGSIAAGDGVAAYPTEEKNVVWEIMTGAPVPDGFDSVIKLEDVQIIRDEKGEPISIEVNEAIAPQKNVRTIGENFKKRDPILRAGEEVTPQHLMVLAAFGVATLSVSERVRVAVLSTGKEVVDCRSRSVGLGKIRNANGPYLVGMLEGLGIEVRSFGTIGDEPREFFEVMERVFSYGPDVIISTGAVSVGRYDFITSGIQELGGEIIFHHVAVRPGKPILFARFRKVASQSWTHPAYFGLPGNPVAVAAGFRFFVEPYLRELLGQDTECPLKVPLAQGVKKKKGVRYFNRGRLEMDGNNRLCAVILSSQMTGAFSSLLEANAWAILPEEVERLETGQLVEMVPIDCKPYRYGMKVSNNK